MMPSKTYKNENVSNENEIETSMIIRSFSQLVIVQTHSNITNIHTTIINSRPVVTR